MENIPTRHEVQRALELRHGAQLQARLSQATVAVCGLGGLGSHLAAALARAGVGRLILVDFDRVELSNLHRQQYEMTQIGRNKTDATAENLKKIAPYVALTTHCVRLTPDNLTELVGEADVICEAFDKAQSKAMLVNHVLERLPEKYLVAASGMAGVDVANTIRTRKITPRFYLCGDGVSDVADGMGLFASRVMVCAAHQAHAAIRLLSQQPAV